MNVSNRTVCWLWLTACLVLLLAGGARDNDWLIGMALTGAVGFGIGRGLRG